MLAKSILRMTYRLLAGNPSAKEVEESPASNADILDSGVNKLLNAVVREILHGYRLERDGIHGVYHWSRVLENGLRLAELNGSRPHVVALFAVFHDARRWNDYHDPDHGKRGADLAAELRGRMFQMSDDDFALLYRACERHTTGRDDESLTVRTCWDADRLDLPRLGIVVDPDRLCTDEARRPTIIRWADERGWRGYAGPYVDAEWLATG